MIDQDFSSFTRLADVVGPIPALKIIAFTATPTAKCTSQRNTRRATRSSA